MNNFELLYSSDLSEIYYAANLNTLKNKWKTVSITMEEMQKEMRVWMTYFEDKKPNFILTNNKVGQIIIPEVQEWISAFLFPKIIQMGVKKWAVILSHDLFSNISVDQMFEESKKAYNEFAIVFFENDEQQGLDWITSFQK